MPELKLLTERFTEKNRHKYKIALMAEYDALPEIGHGCGHCLSGSISILAGLALKICRMIWMRIFILSERLTKKLTAENRR